MQFPPSIHDLRCASTVHPCLYSIGALIKKWSIRLLPLAVVIGANLNAQSIIVPSIEGLVADQAFHPLIATSKSGSYLVSWYEDLPSEADSRSPWKAKLYDSTGQSITGELNIFSNDHELPHLIQSRMVADEQGRFSCFWLEHKPAAIEGEKPLEFNVYVTQFDSLGNPTVIHQHLKQLDSEVGGTDLADFDVGVARDGNYILVWSSSESTFGPSQVFTQRFDSHFKPVGDPLKVSSDPQSEFESHSNVTLVVDSNGSYVVGWLQYSYLDLPERTKESYVQMRTVQVSSAGRVERRSSLLVMPVSLTDDFLPPKMEMVHGKGYFLLAPMVEFGEGDKQDKTVLAARYNSTRTFQSSHWIQLPDSPVDGAVNIKTTSTRDGQLAVILEDDASRNTRLNLGTLDNTMSLNQDGWLQVGSKLAQKMLHPQIVTRHDGTFILAFENERGTEGSAVMQRSVYAGILDLDAPPFIPATPNPYQLEVRHEGRHEVLVQWQSEEGVSYRILSGADVESLQISEVLVGNGERMQHILATDEHDAFFFTITEGD